MIKFVLLVFFLIKPIIAAENKFENIKSILKNDGLDALADQKKTEEEKTKSATLQKTIQRYNVPDKNQIWSFISEYWLVRNSPVIRWDFEKPDYGIDSSFATFLEKINIPEKKFKILLVNTTAITHFALPSNKDDLLFLLSVPFIKSMDLSKTEISLLLYEDMLRVQNDYFTEFAKTKELEDLLGSNFHQKKLGKSIIDEVIKKYDKIIFDKGFSFQQQFQVTTEMAKILKQDPVLMASYQKLLEKIRDLIQSQEEYKLYSKIYPSPEMQLKWILPPKKLL